MNDPIDYDKLRPTVTRGELDALTHEVAQLRTRLDALATNSQLAEFAKFPLKCPICGELVPVAGHMCGGSRHD